MHLPAGHEAGQAGTQNLFKVILRYLVMHLQGMKLAKQAANWREQASEQMRKPATKPADLSKADEPAPAAKHRSDKQA